MAGLTSAKATSARVWANTHSQARAAHAAVARAVRDGHLTPQPCTVCGAEPTVAHHEDYEKKLEVNWLCYSHHHYAHVDNHVPEVPRPSVARPFTERTPNRGRQFRQYILPRTIRLREAGFSYHRIALELNISVATAHKWIKEYRDAGAAPADG